MTETKWKPWGGSNARPGRHQLIDVLFKGDSKETLVWMVCSAMMRDVYDRGAIVCWRPAADLPDGVESFEKGDPVDEFDPQSQIEDLLDAHDLFTGHDAVVEPFPGCAICIALLDLRDTA